MFNNDLQPKLDLEAVMRSDNVADMLDEQQLRVIGHCVIDDFNADVNSRTDWDERMSKAMDLALQVFKKKTFPFVEASNVKFPLVTIAALQYCARAYPALIPDTSIVKMRVIGEDPDGIKASRARRVSDHMSFQVLEDDEDWEEGFDKTLLVQAIVGCAFRKTYYDPDDGRPDSDLVLPRDLYLPYYASSLEEASRISEVLYWSQNDLVSAVNSKLFLDKDYSYKDQVAAVNPILQQQEDEAHGVTRPMSDSSAPIVLIEQHRYLDLDGDGYQEPYIVTVHRESQEVCRIKARFLPSKIKRKGNKIYCIEPIQYYTKYSFIPSPDGSIYDLGFGALLGPINHSINTLINQLIDAGTIANTAGGFLGRGAKFRGGEFQFRPFSWYQVDSTGDDLRKNMIPYPAKDPSAVLYQLLVLLINYGERIGMATDPLVGENPGQNTPAETSRNMLQEGHKQFNSIYKRTWRSLKQEFQKWYYLNKLYTPEKQTYYTSFTGGGNKTILAEDYAGSDIDIRPSADPFMSTDQEKLKNALIVKQSAMQTAGYNTYEVEKQFLKALRVADIETIFPDPANPNSPKTPPPPTVQVQLIKSQMRDQDRQLKWKLGLMRMLETVHLNEGKIKKLEAEAAAIIAEANTLGTRVQLEQQKQQIDAAKAYQDGLLKQVETFYEMMQGDKEHELAQQELDQRPEPGGGGMGSE